MVVNGAMQVDMLYYKGKPVRCLAILHKIHFFLSKVQSFAPTITKGGTSNAQHSGVR
jgi:hypothetical protein